jgi:hypothetical protein
VTAIAGFGVLALSDIAMLRDLGLVTLIDLSVSLVGVLVALPAALLLVGAVAPPDPVGARAPGKRLGVGLEGVSAQPATSPVSPGVGSAEGILGSAVPDGSSPATRPGPGGRHERA